MRTCPSCFFVQLNSFAQIFSLFTFYYPHARVQRHFNDKKINQDFALFFRTYRASCPCRYPITVSLKRKKQLFLLHFIHPACVYCQKALSERRHAPIETHSIEACIH